MNNKETMEQKNNRIPELRFPEFVKNGEWIECALGKVLIKNSKKNRDSKYTTVQSVSNKFGFINQNEYFENRRVASKDTSNYYIIEKGYFAYNPSRIDVGSLAYKNDNETSIISPLYVSFKANNEIIDDIFLLNFFNSNTFTKQMIFEGGVRNTLNYENLILIKVKIPQNLKEQQKIASCLTSLDELITAHTDKLEYLKSHKKGLLQNLFPQENQKVPNYRFPEFVNDGEWERDSLGNVTNYFKGFAFQSKDYSKSGRRIVRVSDMGYDYIKDKVDAIFIPESLATQYKKWELKENDVIITTVGSKPPVYDSLVGRTIIVNSKDDKSLLNQNAVCLRANVNIEQSFLNLLFKKKEYVTFIESIIRGNANQGSITLEDLFKYSFLKPCNPKEQQKIADCLSAVDNLITAQTEKIEQLKNHKKGLMQGLFPKIEN